MSDGDCCPACRRARGLVNGLFLVNVWSVEVRTPFYRQSNAIEEASKLAKSIEVRDLPLPYAGN